MCEGIQGVELLKVSSPRGSAILEQTYAVPAMIGVKGGGLLGHP